MLPSDIKQNKKPTRILEFSSKEKGDLKGLACPLYVSKPTPSERSTVYTQPYFMPKNFLQRSLLPQVIQIYFSKNTACCLTISNYLPSSEEMDGM